MEVRDPHTNPSQGNVDVKLAGVQYEKDPGAVYGEHIMNTGAICNTSASHTYGNVLAVIEKYLLSLVGPDDFKTVIASTTLTSRQLNHLPRQLHKKELPIMVLSPRISFGQGDGRFLSHTLMNERVTDMHNTWGCGSLIPLATDKQKNIYVHGSYNRAVLYVDVVVVFNTYAEQTNYIHRLYNMGRIGHNLFIRSPLELYLPEEFTKLLSNLSGIPIEDENESVAEFTSYMNSIWHHPITYKLKGGSNSNEFFMYYLADLDTVIQEPSPPGTGIKDGQIKRGFDLSFTVRCDFNTIGYFTMYSPRMRKQVIIPDEEEKSIVPIFSDVINLNDFILPMGWSIYSWPIFKLKSGENKISFDNILNESLRIVIDYHLRFKITMDIFISIQFRENGSIMRDELFYIDWGEKTITILQPNMRRTYRLIISVSYDYINKLIKEIYNLE